MTTKLYSQRYFFLRGVLSLIEFVYFNYMHCSSNDIHTFHTLSSESYMYMYIPKVVRNWRFMAKNGFN